MLLETAGSFLAVVAFCFILNTPRRHILSHHGGVGGGHALGDN